MNATLKSFIWNVFRHAFVITTGFTALLHSTWALATLFNGIEPSPQGSWTWLAWVTPAFVFALSIDVGQVWMAVEIRNGERFISKYFAFGVLAIATYYLQWFYMATHFPSISLGSGVSALYTNTSIGVRDAALWIVPGMLPASTFLYTFSFSEVKFSRPRLFPKKAHVPSRPVSSEMTIETPAVPSVSSGTAPLLTEGTQQADELETPGDMAKRLLSQKPELRSTSLTELERLYPMVSRSTWQRAKKNEDA